jgi:phosphatidylinositol alpha-1,6-mannosyltransferase
MPNMRQQGDMEGFGLVVLEAGAHGLPVLAANLEGIRDAVVQGRSGTLLQPEDTDLWTESVLRFLEHETNREQAAQLALATVEERFSWSNMVNSYEALFREVLEERDLKE